MVVFGSFTFVIISGVPVAPATFVHVPVPTVGVFPFNVKVCPSQIVWFEPALAGVGAATIFTTISSKLGWQSLEEFTPVETVHRKVYVPKSVPTTCEVGEFGETKTTFGFAAGFAICVQVPVPAVGTVAFRFTGENWQTIWSTPALAVLGKASLVISIVSREIQAPEVIVQTNL